MLLILAAAPLQAHHSYTSEYDANFAVDLTGTITKVDLINPHSFIHLDVANPDGTHRSWQVEIDSPAQLRKLNVTRELLAVGSVVAITGYGAKDRSSRIFGLHVTPQGGATYQLQFEAKPEKFTVAWFSTLTPPVWVENYFPYALIALPFAILFIGLYILRLQKNKVRT